MLTSYILTNVKYRIMIECRQDVSYVVTSYKCLLLVHAAMIDGQYSVFVHSLEPLLFATCYFVPMSFLNKDLIKTIVFPFISSYNLHLNWTVSI